MKIPKLLSIRLWLQHSLVRIYVALLLLFSLIGWWLIHDLQKEYEKTLADKSLQATQQSQIISQHFHLKIVATDYVLRDVLGRVQVKDLVYPDQDREHFQRMTRLLKEKADTVPDFFTMLVFNQNCVFTALASGQHAGASSPRVLCDERKKYRGPGPQVRFVPSSISVSGMPVIVFSRNLTSLSGEFHGGVLSAIELNTVQHWLDSFDIGAGDSVALLDESQVLLARNPQLTESIEKRVPVPEVDTLSHAKSSSVMAVTRLDLDGRARIFGISKIEGFPFYVTYGIDKTKAIEGWQRRAVQLIASFFTLLLLVFLSVRSLWTSEQENLRLEVERSRLEERELLLQDMHDGFGSQLASASLMAERGLMNQDQVKEVLQECMSDLYLVMDTLSNADNTFADALIDFRYRLQRRLGNGPVAMHWDFELGHLPYLHSRPVLQLLRIIQEALNNAFKHAKAQNIWVEARYLEQEKTLHIRIADDGFGLPEELAKGRGVPGMQSRATSIGATLNIHTKESGAGTEVTLRLKLQPAMSA